MRFARRHLRERCEPYRAAHGSLQRARSTGRCRRRPTDHLGLRRAREVSRNYQRRSDRRGASAGHPHAAFARDFGASKDELHQFKVGSPAGSRSGARTAASRPCSAIKANLPSKRLGYLLRSLGHVGHAAEVGLITPEDIGEWDPMGPYYRSLWHLRNHCERANRLMCNRLVSLLRRFLPRLGLRSRGALFLVAQHFR